MKQWIPFRRPTGYPLSHYVIAHGNGRVATACGRAFDFTESVNTESPRNCAACTRRLTTRSRYLIPSGDRLAKLLDNPQLQLFRERQAAHLDGSAVNAFNGCDSEPVIGCPACQPGRPE